MAIGRRTRDSIVVTLTLIAMLVVILPSLGLLGVNLFAVIWQIF